METTTALPRPPHSLPALKHCLIRTALALAILVIVPRAATAQQTLYVVDNANTIYTVAPDGTKTTFASGLGAVGTIALNASGNVFAGYASASGYGGGIYRFAPDGTQESYTGYPIIANVTGLAFDAAGHLFESEYGTDSNGNSTLHEITQGGVASTFVQLPGNQRHLAFDTAGNLYVADEATNSVTKIAPDGTKSTFATGLDYPWGLAFDAGGNLYVANFGNGNGSTVIRITPQGAQSTYATGLAGPSGLAFDQNGNLFVANFAGTTINEITPAGVKSTFASGFVSTDALVFSAPKVPAITTTPSASAAVGTAYSYQVAAANTPTSYSAVGLPAGLTLDAATGLISGTPTAGGAYTVSLFATNAYGTGSGILTLAVSPGASQQTLYVAENTNGVVKIAPDGTQTQFLTGVGGIGPITLDSVGNLYVGTDVGSGYGGSILRFTPAGTQTEITGYPIIAQPTGLALDANGNLFEAQYDVDGNNNSTLHKITPGGTVTTFATMSNSQYGDAFDSQGNLYVASTGGNSVAKISPTGTVSTFATGLDEPVGLAIDSGDNIYVANNGSGFGLTISKITPAGVVSTYATGLEAPFGLAIDQYGNLYVSNNATHGGGTITEITPAGAKGTFAAGFTNPAALVFGAASSPTPVITSASSTIANSGVAFSYQIAATNSPTSFAVTGLPAGLTLNTSTGLISGTPTVGGTFALTVSATNASGTGSAALSLTVALPVATLTATTPMVSAGSGQIGEFMLSLSTAQANDLVINLAIKGNAVNGSDYVLLKTTKKIKTGKTSKPIKIIPQGDLGGVNKKTVKLVLEPGTGYTVGTTGKVKVSILAEQ